MQWWDVVAVLVVGVIGLLTWHWTLRGSSPQYQWVPAAHDEIWTGHGVRLESCNVQGLPWLARYDKIERYLRHCRQHADVIVLQELFTPRAIRLVKRVLHASRVAVVFDGFAQARDLLIDIRPKSRDAKIPPLRSLLHV